MALAVLLIAGGLQLLLLVGQRAFWRTTVAQWGAVEHAVAAEVLMLRDEKVLYAPIDGKVYALVKAGSRVQRGEAFLEIIDPSVAEGLTEEQRQQLTDRSKRLARLETALAGLRWELTVSTDLRGMLQRAQKKQDLADLDKEIARLHQELSRLNKQRSELLSSPVAGLGRTWSNKYACLTAEEAGVFWPALDGGEGLSPGLDVTPGRQDFAAQYKASSPVLDRFVQAGQPVGKIVVGWQEVVAAHVAREAAALRPEPGRSCRLRLAQGQEIAVDFLRAAATEEGEIWLFRERTLDPALLQKRKFRAMLLPKRTVGVRVPRSALWKKGNNYGVLVPWKNERRITPVELVDADDLWAIVRGIEPGTPVLYH
ncbi:MAG TPA: HlyD family efflux transporter periplasmic adaptor subunit [Bacillota bacterium]|nr:HlyD family efflux transporter periplasmic adaptor subunit [Bacillota bacterium]